MIYCVYSSGSKYDQKKFNSFRSFIRWLNSHPIDEFKITFDPEEHCKNIMEWFGYGVTPEI
jgi:hypothetical protein